jgi:hypothetical protein
MVEEKKSTESIFMMCYNQTRRFSCNNIAWKYKRNWYKNALYHVHMAWPKKHDIEEFIIIISQGTYVRTVKEFVPSRRSVDKKKLFK